MHQQVPVLHPEDLIQSGIPGQSKTHTFLLPERIKKDE
jgi:hypothetical protein